MWLVFAGRGAAGAARRIRDAAPTISLQCVSSTSDLSLDCFSQHMGTCTYTQTVVGDSEEAAVCAGGMLVSLMCLQPAVLQESALLAFVIIWQRTRSLRWKRSSGDLQQVTSLDATRLRHPPRPKLANPSSPDFTSTQPCLEHL